MLDFVAEEMRSGNYKAVPIPSDAKLSEIFTLDDDEDPTDPDNDALGFNYQNDDGEIRLIVRIRRR